MQDRQFADNLSPERLLVIKPFRRANGCESRRGVYFYSFSLCVTTYILTMYHNESLWKDHRPMQKLARLGITTNGSLSVSPPINWIATFRLHFRQHSGTFVLPVSVIQWKHGDCSLSEQEVPLVVNRHSIVVTSSSNWRDFRET